MPAARDPIGVLDSGLGGLSVLKALREELPNEQFLYCADCAHTPWGDKPESFIVERTRAIVHFLLRKQAKAVVLACNTATAAAADILRKELSIPIIGIEPAVKPAAAQTSAGSDVEYVASTATVMGDEGYEIGVGVSDTAAQEDSGYWGLTADSSDAEIWAALTRTMVSVDVKESESAYIYNSTSKGKKLGSVSGLSQGLNLIEDLDDGWSLVEAYRNEDGAFVRGYIRTKTLRTVEPNTLYGIVVDKAAQTLTVYKNGERLGSCAVSTGLATAKYLHRETPAGEYITVTRRGTIENAGGYSKYTIRISGNYYLCEIPTTKKNGKDFSIMEDALGSKASRGNICLAHDASTDGGINAEWIWNITEENKKIKVLVFDDKDRSLVPAGSK